MVHSNQRVATISKIDGKEWMVIREKEQKEYDLKLSSERAIRSYYEDSNPIGIYFIEDNSP